jgi:C4-dicarboxylate transporter DctM subunit
VNNALILALMTFLFLFFGYSGVPVAFALMAGVIVGTMFTPVTLLSMIGQMFNGIDSEALMAIPFFLLVGELMTSAKVIERIVTLSQALVGHVRGGLAQVVTVFSMFFSGMSGSVSADVAVLTKTMAKPMSQQGYDAAFVASLIAAASTIAALVPPSIMAVVYGAVGNVSIAGLFLGGVVPGFMIGIGLMIYSYFFGPAGFRRPRATLHQLTRATGNAGLALLIPVILLGGVLTGWFTPTEAGVVAITYILLVVIPLLNRVIPTKYSLPWSPYSSS